MPLLKLFGTFHGFHTKTDIFPLGSNHICFCKGYLYNHLCFNFSADVNGSLEAILDAIKTYKSDKPKLSVVSSGVGPVTENDIRLVEPFKGSFL